MVQPMKAQVRNGRLVLDEPTELPEGEIVYLHPVDSVIEEVDYDDEEREALLRAIDEGIEDARAGRHMDIEEFARDLRARR